MLIKTLSKQLITLELIVNEIELVIQFLFFFLLQDNGDKVDKQFDFKIEDCLEYVKSGMEAIIEDDVTSRFEAEELKNWNLLTRTNRKYEFISWKLTVIWVIGFLIRYLLLMPLRVIICFIGVSFQVYFRGEIISSDDGKRLFGSFSRLAL